MLFQETNLWKAAFNAAATEPHHDQRERLRTELLRMRERVSQLLSHIPTDCRALTIHDITHLDALWETAETVSGKNWSLNPAETFVLGAAILTHDLGLTSLAYKDGLAGLKSTELWADLSAQFNRAAPSDEGKPLNSTSSDVEAGILFEVLRSKHAEQALELCRMSWTANNSDPFFLIEDSELREAFGEAIGRIASSHHWSTDRLVSELSQHLGGSPAMPQAWTVNECKIACLLRCADAAHVDRARAPLLMYAALRPTGVSALHWNSQRKMNRLALKDDAVHFTSSSAFPDSEAESWWLAFDLASVLDRELRLTNAILTEIGEPTFAAKRVAGAETPEAFSRYVKTASWRPIDASVRVSDPLQLARTLGGHNLYGQAPSVAFRELIQNSADAIRARRALEDRGQEFGCISIIVEHHPSDPDLCLIHIDDNGIGMSERVLATTLVDFGKSFWNSAALREEFPGLKSKRFSSIGKFGIGFFSVFDIASEVTVISKKCDSGVADARALEFKGLVSRPLLRTAKRGELPTDTSTRVTLRVQKEIRRDIQTGARLHLAAGRSTNLSARMSYTIEHLLDSLMGIVAFLDVQVSISDKRNGRTSLHSPDVYGKPAAEFIAELWGEDRDKKTNFFDAVKNMRPLQASNGDSFGRAALDIDVIVHDSRDAIDGGRREARSFVSVGGIISAGNWDGIRSDSGTLIPIFGVIEGRVERASRDMGFAAVPSDVTAAWLQDQITFLDKSVLRKSEVMEVALFALEVLGGDFGLPIAFHCGETKTVSQISGLVSGLDRVFIPVTWRYDSWPELVGYNSLRPEYFEAPLSSKVVVLASGSNRILDEDDARFAKKAGAGTVERARIMGSWKSGRPFIRFLEKLWGTEAKFSLIQSQIFSTSIASLAGDRWVLSIDRHGQSIQA